MILLPSTVRLKALSYSPGGQEMVGQHWSSAFSTTQFLPTGLMKGQTLRVSVRLVMLAVMYYLRKHMSIWL